MANIANLAVQLTANTGKFVKGMRKSRSSVTKLATSVASAGLTLAKFGLAATVGAGLGLTVLVSKSLDTIDALAKLSDKLGIATEKLAGLQLAASQTGVDSKKLALGLQRMTRRVSEAAKGTGEAQAAIKELGLDAKALNQLSPDKQFAAIAEAMEQVASQSDKVRLGFKLFDAEGVDLIRTLDLGAEGLEEMNREALNLGIALSRVDAAKIEIANDSIDRMQKLFEGMTNQLTIKVAPVLAAIADSITSFGTEGRAAGNLVEFAMEQTFKGAAQALKIFDKLRKAHLLAQQGALLTAKATLSTARVLSAGGSPLGLLLATRRGKIDEGIEAINDSVAQLNIEISQLEANPTFERLKREIEDAQDLYQGLAEKIAAAAQQTQGLATAGSLAKVGDFRQVTLGRFAVRDRSTDALAIVNQTAKFVAQRAETQRAEMISLLKVQNSQLNFLPALGALA